MIIPIFIFMLHPKMIIQTMSSLIRQVGISRLAVYVPNIDFILGRLFKFRQQLFHKTVILIKVGAAVADHAKGYSPLVHTLIATAPNRQMLINFV